MQTASPLPMPVNFMRTCEQADDAGQEFMNLCRTSQLAAAHNVLACTVGAPLSYANAESFMSALLSRVRNSAPPVRWLVLRLDRLDEIDYVAAQMLMELSDRMECEGVTLVFGGLSRAVAQFLEDFGVLATIGHERVFSSAQAAVAVCEQSPQQSLADRNI